MPTHAARVLVGLALLIAGCQQNTDTAADPPADADGPAHAPALLADYMAGPARPGVGLADDAVYSPLREGTWTYQQVDPDHAGQSAEQTLSRADDDPHAPWRRADPGSNQIRHLAAGDRHAIVMWAVEDLKRGVISQFGGGIPVMLQTLEPGRPVQNTCPIKVVFRNNPEKIMQQGQCTATLTYEADQRVRVPAGEFDAKRIRLEFNSTFDFAKVSSTSIMYYADGVGLVAEDYVENGVAAIIPWSKKRTLVLTDYPHPRN